MLWKETVLPCTFTLCVATPTVRAAVGVMVLTLKMPPTVVLPPTFRVVPTVALPLRVRPAKPGDAVALMSWIVFTAPAATLKLVALKLARPLVVHVASSRKMF